MANRDEIQEDYLEEWNKQHGNEEPEEKEDPDTPEEEEVVEEPGEEPDTPDPDDKEDPPKEEEEVEEEDDPDEDFRKFIESQPNEELKEQARKHVQAIKSERGRTSALHKKLNATERLVQQLYQRGAVQPQEQPRASAPASAAPDKEPPKTRELPAKLKALKEKSPQFAELIDEVAKFHADASKEELQSLVEDQLKPLQEQQTQAQQALEWERLESMTSDLFDSEKTGVTAQDVINSEDFKAWLQIQQVQNPDVYQLALNAQSAGTFYLVLQKYETDYQAALAQIESQDKSKEVQGDPPANKDLSKGDELRQRRQEKLKKSHTAKSAKAAGDGKDVDNMDYKDLFDLYWGEDGKYRRQNRR